MNHHQPDACRGEECQVLAIRHAPLAVEGLCVGDAEVPCAVPAEEAAARMRPLLDGLAFAQVWSSPRSRCLDPARWLAAHLGATVHVDPRLREINLGVWQGRAWSDIEAADGAGLRAWMSDWIAVAPPGGERPAQLSARVAAWWNELPGGRHLLVAHAGVMRALRVLVHGEGWAQAMRAPAPYLHGQWFVRGAALLVCLACLFGIASTGIGCSRVADARRAQPVVRVVSQTVGSDELLLALAQPAQVAALSHLALEPAYSAVAEQARAYSHLHRDGDVESILKFQPTLVLLANYSREELVTQVERAGIETLVFDRYDTLDDAYANLHRLAAKLGPAAEARATHIEAEGRARLEALRARLEGRPRVRVIAPSTYGLIPGADSTFQDLCDHAGAENLAASLGHLQGHAPAPEEQMLTWPVDLVVVAGPDREQAMAPFRDLFPYRFMPAIQQGRAAVLLPHQLSGVSQHRVEAYERLARALHPEAFP